MAGELPSMVVLEVAEVGPDARGDKKAKLVTGAQIMVPSYIMPGELVVVDTREGTFVRRSTS